MRPAPRHQRPRPKKNLLAKVVLAVCVVGLVVCGVLYVRYRIQLADLARRTEEAPVAVAKPEPEEVPLVQDAPAEPVKSPVDFEALRQQNPDIYAWLLVPNTQVSHPVLQHPTDDFFYLSHDPDGAESFAGSAYTEMQNSKDFTDPVTVIYGHYVNDGLMFSTLHDFKDRAFFDQNPEFQIYTPGHLLTYRIVAAQGTDDAHILNTHDFSDPEQLLAYFQEVQHPTTEEANVREGIELDAQSKLVQLSTCNYTCGNTRYVVTGVLVSDQPTA